MTEAFGNLFGVDQPVGSGHGGMRLNLIVLKKQSSCSISEWLVQTMLFGVDQLG